MLLNKTKNRFFLLKSCTVLQPRHYLQLYEKYFVKYLLLSILVNIKLQSLYISVPFFNFFNTIIKNFWHLYKVFLLVLSLF